MGRKGRNNSYALSHSGFLIMSSARKAAHLSSNGYKHLLDASLSCSLVMDMESAVLVLLSVS